MTRLTHAFVLSLTGLAFASGLNSASSPEEEAPEAPIVQRAPEPEIIDAPRMGVQQLFDMDLRRWPEERFYENLTAQIDALSKSHGLETTSVLLDTAEIYLGQMMTYEAGSVLDAIEPANAAQERRYNALNHAQMLLEGMAVDDFDASPLSQSTRPDRAFWAALQGVAAGDAQMLTANLEPGLLGLMYQTRPVARTLLPLMTEAMIESGADAMARQALRLLDDFPELTDTSVGMYLRGRAAEKLNNESSALASYFKAAKGWDRYSARARLALAEMAIEDGGRGAILAAKDVLEFGADAWKGDHLEVATLRALAKVYHANRDSVEALKVHGRIMLRFPGTDVATESEAQASIELADVYERGVSGELPLADWLTTHYRLVPAFRYYEGFPDYVERMGDHLLGMGGTALAAQEYQRALDLRRDLAIHYPGKKNTAREFDLRYKLAQAYEAGGQLQMARALLTSLQIPEDQMKRDAINLLRADVYAQLGEKDALLKTHVSMPTVGNLRDVAQALWENEEWPEAITFFKRLRAEHPGLFSVEDATYLLIAAHRSGDQETAQMIVADFPGLTESVGWQQLAQGIIEQPADVFPLTVDGAEKRMNSLQMSLESLTKSGL